MRRLENTMYKILCFFVFILYIITAPVLVFSQTPEVPEKKRIHVKDPAEMGVDPGKIAIDPAEIGKDADKKGKTPDEIGTDPGKIGLDPGSMGWDPGGLDVDE